MVLAQSLPMDCPKPGTVLADGLELVQGADIPCQLQSTDALRHPIRRIDTVMTRRVIPEPSVSDSCQWLSAWIHWCQALFPGLEL